MSGTSSAWPEHTTETRPWRQAQRGGTRADRMLTQVTASIPPLISAQSGLPSRESLLLAERAVRAIAYADAAVGTGSGALGRFMVRSESVASSKIELIEASGDDFARASAGNRANSSATSMVAAAEALQNLVLRAGQVGQIRLQDLLQAHRLLMQHDDHPGDRRWAGRLRQEQNWIGGSDYSPRDAAHIPPPPGLVEPLLDDLLRYANRDDIPVFVQAAIVHAQFESIHPFTDGNGRIGRALIGAVLQRGGITRNAVVPLASGLFALRAEYFDALNAYRCGDLDSIVSVTARSATVTAQESLETFERIRSFPEEWRAELSMREDASALRVIDRLVDRPTLVAADLIDFAGGSSATGYAVIALLEQRGIIREVTGRKRDRVWVVGDIVDELEDLDRRIQKRLLQP